MRATLIALLLITACSERGAPPVSPGAIVPPVTRAAGPVVVNAPVAPEAIYVGLGGALPGVSVIDLNGFGQGTGDPLSSRFPVNLNIGQLGVNPPLAPGTSFLDGGSAGATTLTVDSTNDSRLLRATVGAITDMAIGQPLDLLFNNSNVNTAVNAANQVNPATASAMAGNTIAVAPHPNPPRLVVPAPNPAMGIEAEEPTVTSSIAPPGTIATTSPPCVPSGLNLMVPGNPFGTSAASIGLFGANFPGVFYGPQPPPPVPPPPPPLCPYTSRQQIGHFLYLLDRDNRRIVVVNSNRFTVLASIPMPDPVSLAMSPNLKLLAVANHATDSVWFLDVDPLSASFHMVLGVVAVGRGPRALAWQPEGEDLLVCNEEGNTLSILSGGTGWLRRTVVRGMNRPIDVAVTARQDRTGFLTGTYFAYVLNGDGTVAVYESGPGTVGPDDVLGVIPEVVFDGAQAIQPDTSRLGSAVWVAHRDAAGLGQVSLLELSASPVGPRPVPPPPNERSGRGFRNRIWAVTMRVGGISPTTSVRDLLSGNAPVDLAFDDISNLGAFPDLQTLAVPGITYAAHSGKGHVKVTGAGSFQPATRATLLLVALADTGKVDVFALATGTKIATRDAPGVRSLCHYWRQ